VVVAVVAVRMVEVVGNQVVDVISVRHRLMTASGPVGVPGLMALAGVLRGAVLGVRFADLDDVLVDVALVRVMEVAVVEVVHVSVVADRDVAAVRTVLVVVTLVDPMFFRGHRGHAINGRRSGRVLPACPSELANSPHKR
jgi:hypothetical protein